MIWYITNVDTEVLALRTAVEALPDGFPTVRAAQPWTLDELPHLDGATCVLVRLLRGRAGWADGFDELRAACARRSIPFLAFPGEGTPDPELTQLSSVPSATVAQAFAYLVNGGPQNFEHLLRFVADTVLLEGFGFDPPVEVATHGTWRSPTPEAVAEGRPVIGVVFYRAHLVAGNTTFVDDLCRGIDEAGGAPLALWAYSLRDDAAAPTVEALRSAGAEVLITTVLAAGGASAAAGTPGGPGGLDGEAWDPSTLASLDVPILQAPSSGSSQADWLASSAGLGP